MSKPKSAATIGSIRQEPTASPAISTRPQKSTTLLNLFFFFFQLEIFGVQKEINTKRKQDK